MTVGVCFAKKLQSWRRIANVHLSSSLSGFRDCVWEKSRRALGLRYVFIIVRYLNERGAFGTCITAVGFHFHWLVELEFSDVLVTRLANGPFKIKNTWPENKSKRSENCENLKEIRKNHDKGQVARAEAGGQLSEKLRDFQNQTILHFSTTSSSLSSRSKPTLNETMNCTKFWTRWSQVWQIDFRQFASVLTDVQLWFIARECNFSVSPSIRPLAVCSMIEPSLFKHFAGIAN